MEDNKNLTMEEELLGKITAAELENKTLREKLEITQAALDQLLLGGVE